MWWRPQKVVQSDGSIREPQQACLAACGLGEVLSGGPLRKPAAPLIFYGGAAGGGKTDGALGVAAVAMLAIPGIHVGFFRREFSDLEGSEGAIERAQSIIGDIPGAIYNDSKHRWRLTNGSSLRFCHCQYVRDRYGYKSSQFDILIVDESTSFIWQILDFLITRNRSTVRWPGWDTGFSFTLLLSNPGDIGHQFHRQLFIDSGPPNEVHDAETPNGTCEQVIFLPARLEDNAILMERDPDYERKLESRNPVLAAAMRWGDWNVAGGMFFGQHWRSIARDGKPPHIVPDFEIPRDWPMFGSVDYGFASADPDSKPFVYGLYTIDYEGHIYRIDELAAAHWDPEHQISSIKELEARYRNEIRYRVGCPSMFIPKSEKGPTIAETYSRAGVPVVAANTDRINGWARCILWLLDAPDGKPLFMSFQRCRHFNMQIPNLPVDEGRQDDIDRNAEQHSGEEWRHFLMSRPTPARRADVKPPDASAASILRRARKGRRR